ncbi:ISAs1 family transposase [Actinokineospora sp. NBRC 105648]|uniref:ISAs1 family transposase n=1 Tax=Actinokineospora sp. NBRC 105648 TaxID=3032206 RepID=UPI0025566F61|nr:ISAs1 family transposase [Actinokineospora sp. NBRC 105648]
MSHALSSCSRPAASDPGVAGVRALVDMLGGIADPRDVRGIRFRIGTVLAVMVFAVLAGARNFREIGDRAHDLPQELLALAGCPVHAVTGRYVAPSEPTTRRVAHGIDADAADARVCGWLHAHAMAAALANSAGGRGGGDAARTLLAVAMDGKTIRNTIAPGGPEGSEIKLFSALLHEEAIVIAQRRIPPGTNEITQVKALLAGIDLTGMVITGDAAHAQHATAAHLACERGGDYALTVKGNQPALLARIAAMLPPAAPGTEHHVTEDRSRGRIVRRAIWIVPAEGVDFPSAAQVFRIRRDTFDHLGNRLTKEVVHGVTSLDAGRATAGQVAALIRNHWGIENRGHWVRDVVYREDDQHAYAGTGAHVMATLRNLALGLLRLAGMTRIKRTLEHIAADRTRIFPIMATAISTT